ncbi:Crp/Fnr family transcriptional regulator [Dechloromonas sp.]|uniref:Crp/Fnr family transcriptional regulator n=1 Tax=Dechloromonas sp. TaxID=1917218 RepID=UPI00263F878F|nr:Crp/Fnr family transcriptional regulator [Dechloromonas sp.]
MPARLREAAEWREYDKGAALFLIGERPRFIYFIVHGEARLRRHSQEGMEMVMQRARNSFFAEASLESAAYHCDGVATEPVLALAFPIGKFLIALAECPNFRGKWISLLLREVRRARGQVERQGLRNAGDRILHYLETECPSGQLRLNQTKKAWASELGLSHEALYRALGKLSDQGVLRVDGLLIEKMKKT